MANSSAMGKALLLSLLILSACAKNPALEKGRSYGVLIERRKNTSAPPVVTALFNELGTGLPLVATALRLDNAVIAKADQSGKVTAVLLPGRHRIAGLAYSYLPVKAGSLHLSNGDSVVLHFLMPFNTAPIY